jgi:hypothetical protein
MCMNPSAFVHILYLSWCWNSVQINGEDVSAASHEHVVDLIRCSGDLVSMTVVSVGATATGGVPCSKSSTLLPGSGGTSHHRQYATLPRKMNTSTTGTIGKFHVLAELSMPRFPVHAEILPTLFRVLCCRTSAGTVLSASLWFSI